MGPIQWVLCEPDLRLDMGSGKLHRVGTAPQWLQDSIYAGSIHWMVEMRVVNTCGLPPLAPEPWASRKEGHANFVFLGCQP